MADSERGIFDTDDVSTLGEGNPRYLVGYTSVSKLPNGDHLAVVGMLDTEYVVDPYGTPLAESGTAQHANPSTALDDARRIAEQNLLVRSGEMVVHDPVLSTVYDAQNQTS